MPIDLSSRIAARSVLATPKFVSLDEVKLDVATAFDAGRKYDPYMGDFDSAYQAGKQFTWLGADQRGTASSDVLRDSFIKAAEQGYRDGGENSLRAPDQTYKPTLVDPSKATVQPIMDLITETYLQAFQTGQSSFKFADIPQKEYVDAGMVSQEGSWGWWFVCTAALAAVAATGAVLIRDHVVKG